MRATEESATLSCQLSLALRRVEMEVREKLLGEKVLGHQEQTAHSCLLLWPFCSHISLALGLWDGLRAQDQSNPTGPQGHRPAKKWKNFLCWSQAAGDQVFETTLHREFVAGIMDHDKPFIWWDDFMWLLHSEAISISLFLSLGFFSGDIFIAYQMRRKKNK